MCASMLLTCKRRRGGSKCFANFNRQNRMLAKPNTKYVQCMKYTIAVTVKPNTGYDQGMRYIIAVTACPRNQILSIGYQILSRQCMSYTIPVTAHPRNQILHVEPNTTFGPKYYTRLLP